MAQYTKMFLILMTCLPTIAHAADSRSQRVYLFDPTTSQREELSSWSPLEVRIDLETSGITLSPESGPCHRERASDAVETDLEIATQIETLTESGTLSDSQRDFLSELHLCNAPSKRLRDLRTIARLLRGYRLLSARNEF